MFKNFKRTQFLKNDLSMLNDYINELAKSFDSPLDHILSETLLAGGKRLRPALFLICARTEAYNLKYLLPAAAGIEMLHTASLIHDDIIDNSMLRRGKKTIHSLYDKSTARYVGDYLFTYAFYLLNGYFNHLIHEEMSETSQSLVAGEFDQLKTRSLFEQSEEIYLKKINEKTSSLFKLSCVLGGILSDSEKENTEKMREFGSLLGLAFQINDDLIDINIYKSADKIDKPVGNDLKQGNITLPVIYALKDKKTGNELKKLLGRGNFSEQDIRTMLQLINESNAIEAVKEKFFYYLDKAKKTACEISGEERRTGLLEVCGYLAAVAEKNQKKTI